MSMEELQPRAGSDSCSSASAAALRFQAPQKQRSCVIRLFPQHAAYRQREVGSGRILWH